MEQAGQLGELRARLESTESNAKEKVAQKTQEIEAARKEREDLQARYGLAGRRVVLYFGGLKPRKNLGLLLDAWRALAPRHADATATAAATECPWRESP